MVIYELLALEVPFFEWKDDAQEISSRIRRGTLPILPALVNVEKQKFWIDLMNDCLQQL
jgi:hypothetical protein